ncbi:MAG: cytochrome c [Zetaproteobacteria bacterium]|nr:MAG: cytochrome c [Zetaproteobacteria bacterium]
MKKTLLLITIMALPTAVLAWPWSRDLMNQPSIKPQEPPIHTYPKDSVPVGGLWTKVADRDAAENIKNPIPPTKESIAKGRALFRIYCMPCHGYSGKGDGPVGKIFETQPADLTSDYVKDDLTDGWIWGTITFGSYIMPRYGYDMSPTERWHVVNYIRQELEKRMTATSKEERARQVLSTINGNKGGEQR